MRRYVPILFVLLLSGVTGLRAQPWDGGGTDSFWGTKKNGSPNTTPGFTTTTDLTVAGSVRTTPDMNGSRTVKAVTFAAGAAAFSLLGSNVATTERLTVDGMGAGITQASVNGQTLPMNRISWGAAATITTSGAGALTMGDGTATSGQFYGTGNLTKPARGGLVKEGAGELRLTSPIGNTLTGATVITAGSSVAAASNLFNHAVAMSVGNGTRLSLHDFTQTVGSLSGSGTVDLGGGGTGQLVLSGGAALQDQVGFTGFPGNATAWQSYGKQVTPMPEPGVDGAMLAAAAGALVAGRRWWPARPRVRGPARRDGLRPAAGGAKCWGRGGRRGFPA